MCVLLYGQMSSFASIPKQLLFVRFFAPSRREPWLALHLRHSVLFCSARGWCGNGQTHDRLTIYLGSPKSFLVVIISHKIRIIT